MGTADHWMRCTTNLPELHHAFPSDPEQESAGKEDGWMDTNIVQHLDQIFFVQDFWILGFHYSSVL